MTRSSDGRFSKSFCAGTLGTRNFLGIVPPHVLVRKAWPLPGCGDSDSRHIRFGGDCFNDFLEWSRLSSRFRLLPGVDGADDFPRAYDITDGRLAAVLLARRSRVDLVSLLTVFASRFSDGDDADK